MRTIASAAASLTIGGAEGITFEIPLAGPLSRFLAWVIDLAVITVAFIAMNVVLSLLALINVDIAMGAYMFLSFAILLSYGIIFEWFWRGQTIGKRFMRLRVKDERGLRLRFDQVVLRNLLRVVDLLPVMYLVGGLTCLVSRRSQRLGDIAAGTVVVYEPKTTVPDLKSLAGDKYNTFRKHPHLEARLRQLAPPAAGALAVQALMRRDNLNPADRLAVFKEMADYFRRTVAFPEADTLGIADEQYVRNVVDSLFRTKKTTAQRRS
jgi:uncharacterized RDD family membrane protein YckC